jgi:hypothetical protein
VIVRVPDISSEVGGSAVNDCFSRKEAAIAWSAVQRTTWMAGNLRSRPAGEQLADALVAAVTGSYNNASEDGQPAQWLPGFRAMVSSEPALYGELLKAAAAAEAALARAISERIDGDSDALRPQVIAAVVVGAERAAVRHWLQTSKPRGSLVDTVRTAVRQALAGVAASGQS